MAYVKAACWSFYLDGYDVRTVRLRRSIDLEGLARAVRESDRPLLDVVAEHARDAVAPMRRNKRTWLAERPEVAARPASVVEVAYDAYIKGVTDRLTIDLAQDAIDAIGTSSETLSFERPNIEPLDKDDEP